MGSLEVEIFFFVRLGSLSEDDLGIVVIDQFVSIVIHPIPVGVLVTGNGRQTLQVIQFLLLLSFQLQVHQFSLITMLILLLLHQLIELMRKLFLFLDLFA